MKRKLKVVLFIMCFIAVAGAIVFVESEHASAAVIGDVLKSPESGWKRIDNTNKNLKFNQLWDFKSADGASYNGTLAWSKDGVSGSTFEFKFKGTKFRIIGLYINNTFGGGSFGSTESTVVVDGVKYRSFSCLASSEHQKLVYNLENLSYGVHTVTITNMTTNSLCIDAIDVDNNAEIINANSIGVSEIKLNRNALSMQVKGSQQLSASISPENAENKNLTWTSSDKNVCTVDENGNVQAVGEGRAVITATSKDGSNKTDSCSVTVSDESNRGVLNIYMVDDKVFTYDLNMMQAADFTDWFEERCDGKGKNFYLMKTTPSSGVYSSHTDCLKYDNISYYTLDTYRK